MGGRHDQSEVYLSVSKAKKVKPEFTQRVWEQYAISSNMRELDLPLVLLVAWNQRCETVGFQGR